MKILLADDEKTIRITLTDDLEDAGHKVVAVDNGESALNELERKSFDCVITDLRMPGADGMEVLERAIDKGASVVVLTGAATVESAVDAMRKGAYEYLQKPFVTDELLLVLKRIEEKTLLQQKVDNLTRKIKSGSGFSRVIYSDASMDKVINMARAAAGTDAGVLITGESGTGKEVMARALHEESARAEAPFVVISCGVLSETLLEDELFGHEKGAFTGANSKRIGRFESANGGTVFLDDIDDMPLATQVKLLRVLQERTIERVGGNEPISVDIRIVAATKVELENLVKKNKFREDLFYRLNIINLKLPKLSKRKGDILLLANYFLKKASNDKEMSFSAGAVEKLLSYKWPGNIRELENAVTRAVILASPETEITANFVPPCETFERGGDTGMFLLSSALEKTEKRTIEAALMKADGVKTAAAEILGISRKHLWDRMKKLGIDYKADGSDDGA